MTTVQQVYEVMQRLAPPELAEHWDNPGLLVDCGGEVRRVLVTLDITPEVVAEAAAKQCTVIVAHHRSSLTRSSGCAPPMCPISWCRRAFPPSVCTPIWMPPRAG